MPTATLSRDELLAEYVARDALNLVENRIYGVMFGEDRDIFARLPADEDEGLVHDARLGAVFAELFPTEANADSVEGKRASAESCYVAARILRAIVYHADHLRGEAEHPFRLSDKTQREADELEKAGGDA